MPAQNRVLAQRIEKRAAIGGVVVLKPRMRDQVVTKQVRSNVNEEILSFSQDPTDGDLIAGLERADEKVRRRVRKTGAHERNRDPRVRLRAQVRIVRERERITRGLEVLSGLIERPSLGKPVLAKRPRRRKRQGERQERCQD